MRKLATIRRIERIIPIPKADRIEKALIGGWPVVVQKGKHQVGELVVYCEIDSLLPIKPEYEFLNPYTHVELDGTVWYRLRTVRFRGQLSQGLILPLETAPDVPGGLTDDDLVGADLTALMGIRKYDPPPPICGELLGGFPYFIPQTDEVRIQNLDPAELDGKLYSRSEKLDGTSCTVFWYAGHAGVCSRNNEVKPGHGLWKAAEHCNVLEAVRCSDLAVQGEVCGPGVQGNPYRLPCHKFFAYNIWDITNQRYLPKPEFYDWCLARGVETVPALPCLLFPGSVEAVLADAEGPSILNPDREREGVVWVHDGPDERTSFKAISNKFLLGGGN